MGWRGPGVAIGWRGPAEFSAASGSRRETPNAISVFGGLSSLIQIVSLKVLFKGMTGSDRRGNAGHCRTAYQTGISAAKRNRRLHLSVRIAQAVTRFEDSLLGAAFGVALLFGLLIAALSVGGW